MNKYYSGMTSLRAIAIFSVIFYHLLPNYFSGGFLGVNLFFVLSGFLMTSNILNELKQADRFNFKKFYMKRFERIYPSLFLLLGVLLVFVLISKTVSISSFLKDSLASLLSVNNQWQLINEVSYFDQFKNLNLLKHLWSLSIEVQFYLIYPIFLNFFSKKLKASLRQINWMLVILTLVSFEMMMFLFFTKDVSYSYYASSARLFSFTIGGIFSIQTEKKKMLKYPKIKFLMCLILVCLSFLLFKDHSFITYNGGMLVFSVLCGCLIYYIVESNEINQLLTVPFLSFIGIRSYDMYLFYFPTITIFQYYSDWDGRYALIVTILLTAIIITLGGISYNITAKFEQKDFAYNLLISVALIMLTYFIFFVERRIDYQLATRTTITHTTSSSTIETTTSQSSSTSETTEVIAAPKNILLIGDSVLLGASQQLEDTFQQSAIKIDAKVGRQPYELIDVIANDQSTEDNTYVISTGNNGLLTTDIVDRIVNEINENSSLYFITTAVPRSWKTSSNQAMRDATVKYKNVYLIDWDAKVAQNPDNNWFDGDDIHTNFEGALVYSELIQQAIISSD